MTEQISGSDDNKTVKKNEPLLRIAKWHEFQHYSDRRPIWIKVYTELLMNDKWCHLSDESRAHIVGLWLLASFYDGEIPFRPDWIARQISAKRAINWPELVDSQFVELNSSASALVGLCASSEKRREEKKRETKRASTIPMPFEPTPTVRRWAGEKFPALNFDEEAEAFADYHQSKGSVFVDWEKALQTWIRNSAKWRRDGNRPDQRSTKPPAPAPTRPAGAQRFPVRTLDDLRAEGKLPPLPKPTDGGPDGSVH